MKKPKYRRLRTMFRASDMKSKTKTPKWVVDLCRYCKEFGLRPAL